MYRVLGVGGKGVAGKKTNAGGAVMCWAQAGHSLLDQHKRNGVGVHLVGGHAQKRQDERRKASVP